MSFSIFLLPIRNNLPIRIILENAVMLITSENTVYHMYRSIMTFKLFLNNYVTFSQKWCVFREILLIAIEHDICWFEPATFQ